MAKQLGPYDERLKRPRHLNLERGWLARGWAVITTRFTKTVQAMEEVNAELLLPKSHHATNQQTIVETSK